MTRQRQAARGTHNTLDKQPHREWICLIGAPTNTFNGWASQLHLDPSRHPEVTGDDRWLLVRQPAPKTARDVVDYVSRGPQKPPEEIAAWNGTQDKQAWETAWRSARSKEQWEKLGWNEDALDKISDLGWSPSEVTATAPSTHDLYWGNFALSARRLYGGGAAIQPPLTAPRPRQGDIVTFLVWWPGYEKREEADYRASPYNPANFEARYSEFLGDPPKPHPPKHARKDLEAKDKDYVNCSLTEKANILAEAAKAQGRALSVDEARQYLIWEGEQNPLWGASSLPEWEQRMIFRNALARALDGHAPGDGPTIHQRGIERQLQRKREFETEQNKSRTLSDAEIDREILARRIGPNGGEIVRRNTGATISQFIHGLVEHVGASGTLHSRDGSIVPDIQAKVLLIGDIGELISYVADGAWTGQPIGTFEDAPEKPPPKRDAWVAALPKDQRTAYDQLDATDQQGWYDGDIEYQRYRRNRRNYIASPRDRSQSPDFWTRHWDKTPRVDRSKVKIARFDYIGHASQDQMALEYGWWNAKGEWPEFDVKLGKDELQKMFSGHATDADAEAILWGCHLGVDDSTALARVLYDKHYFHHVVAADTSTDFHQIASAGGAMPVPSNGKAWVEYPKKKKP